MNAAIKAINDQISALVNQKSGIDDQVNALIPQLDQLVSQVRADIDSFKNVPIGLNIDLAVGAIADVVQFTEQAFDDFVTEKTAELGNDPNVIQVLVLDADRLGYTKMTFAQLKPLVVK